MANLTKEERQRLREQQQQERDLQEQEHLAKLPLLLLNLCARAQSLGVHYEIFVAKACDGKTVGGTDALKVKFTGEFQNAEMRHTLSLASPSYEVDSCIREFDYFASEVKRHEEKMQLRKEVLARLSEAEKDALGLKF